MLELKSSDDVIACLVAQFQMISDCDDANAEKYGQVLRNLVQIARFEQIIHTAEDLRKVDEITGRSKH